VTVKKAFLFAPTNTERYVWRVFVQAIVAARANHLSVGGKKHTLSSL
jgi:hypothetical protein